MMNLAPALAVAHSVRFQSCGTEIGLARAGYAVADSPLCLSLTEAGVLRPVVLGSMWMARAAAMHPRRPRSQLDGGRSQSADWNRPDSRMARAAVIREIN